MERPFNYYRDLFRKQNEQNKEMLKYVFEKSDSISLWIIGIAIGGISIIANNIADIQKAIAPAHLKPILFLLAISVTCGIVYRSLYLYFFVLNNQNLQGIDIAFSRDKVMDTESSLKGDESFEEVVSLIKNGFEEDLSQLIPLYHQSNDEQKKKLFSDMVNHYKKSVEFAQEDTQLAIGFYADTYSKFFGVPKEKYLNAAQKKNGAGHYKIIQRLTTFFYLLYLLSFIIALFLFASNT